MPVADLPSLEGKVCVVTGATSGIGMAAAEALGVLGARLVLVGRNPARAEAALQRLKSRAPRVEAHFHLGDLSILSEMHRLGREIAEREPRIDVLLNNAGAITVERQVTPDGLERMFALNHMAYFVITAHLRPCLEAAGAGRIVNVASGAHRGQVLDFGDLQSTHSFGPMRTYGRSKLANILFTRELARRLAGTQVTANCFHPGFVATRIADDAKLLARTIARLFKLVFAKPPARGAETAVYLAASPEVAGVTGGYFEDCRPATPSPASQDDDAARRLWEISADIAQIAP